MIRNETAKTIYYHGAKHQCYEIDSKDMLSIIFLCLLLAILFVNVRFNSSH